MKLYVESALPIPAADAWDLFESDEYRTRLREQAQIHQEVVNERKDGDMLLSRTVRTEPDRELPAVMATMIGAAKLAYVQESTYDTPNRRIEWTVRLEVMSDKVDVRGTTVVKPDGADGSLRVVDGDISVRVPLVGKRIEKVVVAEFEKSMKRAAEVAVELLEERGLA